MAKDDQLVCGKILLFLVPLSLSIRLQPPCCPASPRLQSEGSRSWVGFRAHGTPRLWPFGDRSHVPGKFKAAVTAPAGQTFKWTLNLLFPFGSALLRACREIGSVTRRNSPAPSEERVSLPGRKLFCQNISRNVLPAHLDVANISF